MYNLTLEIISRQNVNKRAENAIGIFEERIYDAFKKFDTYVLDEKQ